MEIDKFLAEIKKHRWKSLWGGGWVILDCSILLEDYLQNIRVGNGNYLPTVTVVENGRCNCWATEDSINAFSKNIADSHGDPDKIRELASDLVKKTKILLNFMKENYGKANKGMFCNYIKNFHGYYTPHVRVKYIVDGLSPKKLKEYLPILEKSRIFAEPVFENNVGFNKSFAKQLSVKTGVSPDDILNSIPSEIEDFFDTGILSSGDKIEERKKISVIIFPEGKPRVISGNCARIISGAIEFNFSQDKLVGSCAFPGKITGRVRVVLDPRQVDNFEVGDILVTVMTRPDYLPLMMKSIAFITDAGGMLSHAAITARELKKPCIVGTKIATKVFKDGDIVEVDANKGIVRIIK